MNASRPVSRVLYGRGSSPRRDGHSSGTPVAGRLKQPTRATGATEALRREPRIAPIRSCSRRGLPCRRRCRLRGALLPHPFTLTPKSLFGRSGRFAFCGAFPGVAPAGRYPAPYPHGARTFLRLMRRPSSRLASVGIGGARGDGQVKSGARFVRASGRVGAKSQRRRGTEATFPWFRACHADRPHSLQLHRVYGNVAARGRLACFAACAAIGGRSICFETHRTGDGYP